LYENHAVNANTIFDPNAQDIYRNSGYRTPNIARSIANSAQLQGESAQTQRDFITNTVTRAKATGNKAYEDAAIRATIDARRNGVVSLKEIYDSKTPYAYAQDQNIKDLGQAVAVASVGNIKSNGNVLVRLKDGTTKEVPASAVVKGRDGKVFTKKENYQAPESGTGHDYRVYQREIDMDTKFIDPKTKRVTTNRELMEKGKAPYVIKNGKREQVQLHHSRQNAQGPLFELTESTHKAKTTKGREALHPYTTKRGHKLNGEGSGDKKSLHPYNPVDRTKFNTDRKEYWKQRAKE
jgi:hypothetical protein